MLMTRLLAVKPPPAAPVGTAPEAQLEGPAGDVAGSWDASVSEDLFFGNHPGARIHYYLPSADEVLSCLPDRKEAELGAKHVVHHMQKRLMATRSRAYAVSADDVTWLLDAAPCLEVALGQRFRGQRAIMWHQIPGSTASLLGRTQHPVILPESEWLAAHQGNGSFENAVSVPAILYTFWEHPAEVQAGELSIRTQPPGGVLLKQFRMLGMHKLFGQQAPRGVRDLMSAALRYGILQQFGVQAHVQSWVTGNQPPPTQNPEAMKNLAAAAKEVKPFSFAPNFTLDLSDFVGKQLQFVADAAEREVFNAAAMCMGSTLCPARQGPIKPQLHFYNAGSKRYDYEKELAIVGYPAAGSYQPGALGTPAGRLSIGVSSSSGLGSGLPASGALPGSSSGTPGLGTPAPTDMGPPAATPGTHSSFAVRGRGWSGQQPNRQPQQWQLYSNEEEYEGFEYQHWYPPRGRGRGRGRSWGTMGGGESQEGLGRGGPVYGRSGKGRGFHPY
jgi:hypothetical protein